MKCRKLLVGLIALLPLTFESCSNAVTYERAKEWVRTNYTEIFDDPWYAIATFTWDYHATVGDKAMGVVEKLMGGTKETRGKDGILAKIIPQFKNVVYFPGSDQNKLIGKSIIVYEPLLIHPLTSDHFDDEYFGYSENDSYKINNKELTVTHTIEELEVDSYKFKCTIIHVHNRYGFYRGIGFKIGYGYMDSENIVKLKVITEFTYEDS
ncbi:MAG: hypothetical protein MJ208_04445 [Bacilli bacterium]|nr:hypothetical protein [Bacilli bacterium]